MTQDKNPERTARGLATVEKLTGKRLRAAYEARIAAGGIDGDLARLAVEFAFAEPWSRPGLELRERSLVVISMMIALRQTQELKAHLHMGISNGLTPAELGEVLIQVTPYVGFPAMNGAYAVLKDVLSERGLELPAGQET